LVGDGKQHSFLADQGKKIGIRSWRIYVIRLNGDNESIEISSRGLNIQYRPGSKEYNRAKEILNNGRRGEIIEARGVENDSKWLEKITQTTEKQTSDS